MPTCFVYLQYVKCAYLEFFWLVVFRSQTEYGDLLSKCSYSVRIQEKDGQKNSEYGHFQAMLLQLKTNNDLPIHQKFLIFTYCHKYQEKFRYLLGQIRKWKHQNNVSNLFKVNSNDNRTSPLMLFWLLRPLTLNILGTLMFPLLTLNK